MIADRIQMTTFSYRRDRSARTYIAESLSSVIDYLLAQYPLSKMLLPLPNRNIAETFYCNTIFWICVTDFDVICPRPCVCPTTFNPVAHVKLLH